jgi:hypothetical protein
MGSYFRRHIKHIAWGRGVVIFTRAYTHKLWLLQIQHTFGEYARFCHIFTDSLWYLCNTVEIWKVIAKAIG